MEEVPRDRPFDLEWLRTALPSHPTMEYLTLFRDNLLYYPPVGSPAGHSASVLSILTSHDPHKDFADNDLTQTPNGVVPYRQALLATERIRQVYHPTKKIFIAMMDTLLENYMHATSVVSAGVQKKSRANVTRQVNQNRSAILAGVARDLALLKTNYGADYASSVGAWKKNYGRIENDTPSSKVRWMLDVIQKLQFDKKQCLMLMDKGCTMEALVIALSGLRTQWQRDNAKPFPYEESSPHAMLFVRRCYLSPHDQQKVVFDRRSVTSTVTVKENKKVNYIRIEPTIGASNKFVVFEKDNWFAFSMSDPPETRSRIIAILIAYNFFDTAKIWIETWGDPNPEPVTYNVIEDPTKFATLSRLVPDLRDVFNDQKGTVMLTVAQTKQLVKELTGNCPDFKASDEVHPTANKNPGRAKESVYKAPPKEGEVIGERESGPAKGGIAESEPDVTRVAKEIEGIYESRVTTIPLTKEQQKAADKESDGNWMLLALAGLGVLAYNMR